VLLRPTEKLAKLFLKLDPVAVLGYLFSGHFVVLFASRFEATVGYVCKEALSLLLRYWPWGGIVS
jgi:hypothetical protein